MNRFCGSFFSFGYNQSIIQQRTYFRAKSACVGGFTGGGVTVSYSFLSWTSVPQYRLVAMVRAINFAGTPSWLFQSMEEPSALKEKGYGSKNGKWVRTTSLHWQVSYDSRVLSDSWHSFRCAGKSKQLIVYTLEKCPYVWGQTHALAC